MILHHVLDNLLQCHQKYALSWAFKLLSSLYFVILTEETQHLLYLLLRCIEYYHTEIRLYWIQSIITSLLQSKDAYCIFLLK